MKVINFHERAKELPAETGVAERLPNHYENFTLSFHVDYRLLRDVFIALVRRKRLVLNLKWCRTRPGRIRYRLQVSRRHRTEQPGSAAGGSDDSEGPWPAA